MTKPYTMALFGEAEKGNFYKAYHCDSLHQLVDCLGNPPPESRGLYFAIQALLFNRRLIFFRVEEEGFSYQDYLKGLKRLESGETVSDLSAIGLPGVGDSEIIDAAIPLCHAHNSILITTEPDLYDYLTDRSEPDLENQE